MGSSGWRQVPLGEVFTQVFDEVRVDDDTPYKQVTVRLHGKGAILRREVSGSEIKTKRQFNVKAGQLVYSRIDARYSAIAIIPNDLDGAIVSNDFPVFNICTDLLESAYLEYYVKTHSFQQDCAIESSGTTKRTRLKEDKLLQIEIPLPSLDEQRRIVERIKEVELRLVQITILQEETEQAIYGILLGAYRRIVANAPQNSMAEVAPLVRRTVKIVPDEEYPELGLRSWGKGTFHKPAIKGSELNGKRLYKIEAGDLVFSNVFSWEGAVAVARPEDDGRFGSHRFISRVAKPGIASAQFLYFHFMTEEGLQQLREASPGSVGRNRTLGLKALDAIQVPVPDFELQCWFDKVYQRVEALRQEQAEVVREVDALLPAVLERAFRGDL